MPLRPAILAHRGDRGPQRRRCCGSRKRGGGIVDVHAHRLRSPLTGTEGVRQFQFAQLPDGLEITISLFSGFDIDVVGERIETAVRERRWRWSTRSLVGFVVRAVDTIRALWFRRKGKACRRADFSDQLDVK